MKIFLRGIIAVQSHRSRLDADDGQFAPRSAVIIGRSVRIKRQEDELPLCEAGI